MLRLALIATCVKCNEARNIAASGKCAVCGTLLPADEVAAARDAIRSRRGAFKARLKQLEQRMHSLTDDPLTFAKRGAPRSAEDHFADVLLPALNSLGERDQTMAELMGSCTWDPSESGCIDTFTMLVRTLDADIDLVTKLRETMPPIEWRAVHREITRATAHQVRGHIYFALTLSAPDLDVVLRLQKQGNDSFDLAMRHAKRVSALIDLLRPSSSDGPFKLDGSLDIATLAWSSIGEKGTLIAQGAEIVRSVFGDLPGIPSLGDEYALFLLPLVASGARVVDHRALVERAAKLRSVLDAADLTDSWVVDPSLLIARAICGAEIMADQVERLGREWRFGLPRIHIMKSLTEVYRELVEGTLSDFGTIILIAARAQRGDPDATYEQDIVDGIKAGDVITELERLGSPFSSAIDMIYRNASAHAGIRVTDTGIIATARRIENGRAIQATRDLSDAEFSEEMVGLQETLLALQLVVFPWLWSHPNEDIVTAVKSMPPSARQRDQTLALLGGLAGLRDITASVDGGHIIVSAVLLMDNESGRRETGILSLIPAAFSAVPSADRVTIHLQDLQPVTFTGVEYTEAMSEAIPYGLTLLGFLSAKWLLQSKMSWTSRDEATYVTLMLTQFHFDCAKLACSTPIQAANIDNAVAALLLVRSRLDGLLASDCRSPLTQRIVKQLSILSKSFTGLAKAAKQGQLDSIQSRQLARQAADTTQVVYEIQEAAKAIRDADLG